MTPEQLEFYESDLRLFENLISTHDLAALFNGPIYTSDGVLVNEIQLGDNRLNANTVARLFILPAESVINVRSLHDNGSVYGVTIESENALVQADQTNSVSAYRDLGGNSVRIDELHLDRILLDSEAPIRLCTIAFGLMAIEAFKNQFSIITLFAAGRAPLLPADDDSLIGYSVWPKFGFDAAISPVEIQNREDLRGCRTVRDILDLDPYWWDQIGGSEREMAFDLSPGSASWTTLIQYSYDSLA